MALNADKRIPDTTLPLNSFKDGDVLYGADMNRVSDTLKTAVNENYKDLKLLAEGKGATVVQPEGDMPFVRINDLGLMEYSTDGVEWKLSGGHVILDENGDIALKKSKIQFEGASVLDGGDKLIIKGFQGKQGNDGPQGKQGIQGPQGNDGKSAVIPEGVLYTLTVQPNGDLYLEWSSGDNPPQMFELDEEGNLYALINSSTLPDGDEVMY